jgi:deaminated glutathione amidase
MNAITKPSEGLVRIALIQMRSLRSPDANLDAAAALIRQAKAAGARYVLTPEMTNVMGLDRGGVLATVGTEDDDRSLAGFRELARELKLYIHLGSLALRTDGERAVNRSFLLDAEGDILARYDKIHMFDVDLDNGESYRESHTYVPGDMAVVADLPWGRLGLSICYDVRFPALYRALAEAGASMITVPAAFTRQTGEAHWTVLLRARAIETGCFVLAAAQGGMHENSRQTYGHSMVVDPWGKVLAEGGVEPACVIADLDLSAVGAARRRIPSLQHGRRFEMLAPMAEPSYLHAVKGTA